MKAFKYTVIAGLMIITGNTYSQFSGNNLFEVQWGNLPDDEPPGLLSNYNQLNLNYRYKGFRASGRVEYFINQFSERRYINPSQLQLQYKTKSLEFKAGTFYDMLGNGLLLRAYDIPSSIFESPGYRVRQGFYRDILGFSGSWSGKVFHLKALYGKPLVNVLPPTLEWKERRAEDLVAVNPGITLGEQNIELNYMYSKESTGSHHFSSAHVTGNLPWNLSYNVEMAAELGTGIPLFSGNESTQAVYAGLMYSGWKLGGSLEWKNYKNFVLGSGYNDPPTLVKEQSYKVLNRSTHVPRLSNEMGYQAEVYYRFESGHVVTLNNALARNERSGTKIFHEYFAEIFMPLGESASLKWFADYSQDPIQNEDHRLATGGIFETPIAGKWSSLAELEYQYIDRSGFIPGAVHNAVLIASLSHSTKFSFSITWELSTDPFLTDDPDTFPVEKGSRHWLGIDTKYKIGRKNTITLFAGQRRGGPACASGICYEVLDFTGLELRFTSKF